MMYPLVLDLADDGVPVTVTCRVLGFSTQAFYKWRKTPLTQRDWDDAHLINAARDIHADDPAFGYRFIADELAGRGIVAGENKVARLCRQERIWSIFAKKRGLNRRSGPPVHDDLVDRRFCAQTANEVWLTDITEHHTDEGKLYLCAIKDVYSNRIVGYSMDSRMKASLAVAALGHAMAVRFPVATIVHSDRGSQGGFNWSTQHRSIFGRCSMGVGPATGGSVVSVGADSLAWSTHGGLATSDRVRFWAAIAAGAMTEDAAAEAGVSSPVFVGAALPWALGIGEVHLDPGGDRELGVSRQFLAPEPGQRPP